MTLLLVAAAGCRPDSSTRSAVGERVSTPLNDQSRTMSGISAPLNDQSQSVDSLFTPTGNAQLDSLLQ
jgi:hypothetical protein